MFGFLAACIRDPAYRGLYSRCCQHQHFHYGKFSLPTLTYEAVFTYAMGLDAGGGGGYQPKEKMCCRLLGKNDAAHGPDRVLGEFSSSLGLLLASVKLADDIQDSKKWIFRVIPTLHRQVLAAPIAKATNYLRLLDSQFDSRISELVSHQASVESEKVSDLSDYALPTSLAFQYLLGLMAKLPNLAKCEERFARLGRCIGEAIITFDCAQDWQVDRKNGLPNPVQCDQDAKKAIGVCVNALETALAICRETPVPLERCTSILEHCIGRVRKTILPRIMSARKTENASQRSPGVVLNAACCVPCGDSAVVFDTDDCVKCTYGACIGIFCCLPACCDIKCC